MVDRIRLQQSSGQLPQEGEDAAMLLAKEGFEQEQEVIQAESTKLEKLDGITFESIDKKLQQEVVLFEVDEIEDGKIVIRGRHQRLSLNEQLDTEAVPAPQLSFDQSLNSQTVTQIYGQMRLFSQQNKEAKRIRGWLIKLRDKLETEYNQALTYVVINDHTMFEIPWELLELKRDIFLGSEFMATRWQNISDPDDFDNLDANIELTVCRQDCCGEVVAYLNTKDLASVKEEQEMLQEKFQPKQIYPNIKEFLNFLDGVKDNVSLVFIASHGFFGSDISASGLGGEDRREKISLAELYEYDFDFFEKCKSIVFMNTCHSGRLQQNDRLNLVSEDSSIGFSTFFLEKGAAGVIGTLCEVADNYAAKVSRNFFNEWEKNNNLTVAKILTNLRYQSLEKYRQEKTDENKLLLLITFMYVYYGNPMARLNIFKGGRE